MAFMPSRMANRTMIPAAASPLYSSLGSLTQANICIGRTVKRSRGDDGSKVKVHQGAYEDDRRRFAYRSGHGEDGAGEHARNGRRKDHGPDHVPLESRPTRKAA